MRNRSAVDTIIGYFYQFDLTIKKLLELENNSDSIIVERVEDVDVKTATSETAIQCKYYAKTTYNHSIIKKTICFMLSHFMQLKIDGKNTIQYSLYGHYKNGQQKLILPLTVSNLKKDFLTSTSKGTKHRHHNVVGASDYDLEEFISLLHIDIHAEDFSTQLSGIFSSLQDLFNCTEFEAENYYYNNAFKVIKDISIEQDASNRALTKEYFIEIINNKSILFNHWFVEFRGIEKHFKLLRSKFFTSLNTSPYDRFFLIEIDNQRYNRTKLKELIFIISQKWSKISSRESSPFCPYIYIDSISESELIDLKSELITEGFKFIDGFDFCGSKFSAKSITEIPNCNNGIKSKIINKKQYIDIILSESSNTKEIYQFYYQDPFYENDSSSIKHVRIQISEITNIKEII